MSVFSFAHRPYVGATSKARLIDIDLSISVAKVEHHPSGAHGTVRLEAHDWPGNVRELENALERLAIFCAGRRVVGLEQVELALAGAGAPAPSARVRFEEDERGRLEALLERFRWNVSAVARELGVSRGALRYRLRKHGLVT